jgi:hypothetical protein
VPEDPSHSPTKCGKPRKNCHNPLWTGLQICCPLTLASIFQVDSLEKLKLLSSPGWLPTSGLPAYASQMQEVQVSPIMQKLSTVLSQYCGRILTSQKLSTPYVFVVPCVAPETARARPSRTGAHPR